jgi:hypothetical protein
MSIEIVRYVFVQRSDEHIDRFQNDFDCLKVYLSTVIDNEHIVSSLMQSSIIQRISAIIRLLRIGDENSKDPSGRRDDSCLISIDFSTTTMIHARLLNDRNGRHRDEQYCSLSKRANDQTHARQKK